MNSDIAYGSIVNPLTCFGAQPKPDGVRFTLFSRNATNVWLMLFDHPDSEAPFAEYELERIGDIWSIFLYDTKPGVFYLYRADGPDDVGNFFDPEQWLLDPYAKSISGHYPWNDREHYQGLPWPKNGSRFPKGEVTEDFFDWTGDKRPNIPLSKTIIYEMHVRGFTQHQSSHVMYPGTYEGLKEKLPYLKSLGINTIELMPIFEFNELEYLVTNDRRKDLQNYWGYSTYSFFAPMSRYSAYGHEGEQVYELKSLVKAIHQHDMEIILDVVYNHTAENGRGGPVYSYRGIDNSLYYILNENEQYMNYSGCGNTVNANQHNIKDFILDSLRYWVTEYHIDGFRFDLASALLRGPEGHMLAHAPLVEAIDNDPILRNTKMIAEAWDAAGAYHVGSFPSNRWPEWNGKYRDNVRSFWKKDRNKLGALASHLIGSDGIYWHTETPLKSINFITCHDGFTLRDVVSYDRKHNEANNENNADGENHNESHNYGVEGPTDDEDINRIRKQQQKNFFCTLLMSQGVPMILSGDEFSQSQNGNNNSYCQDNENTWLNWDLVEEHGDLVDFVKGLIEIRKDYQHLFYDEFMKKTQFEWHGPKGEEPLWHEGHSLGLFLKGGRRKGLFILLNSDTVEKAYILPYIKRRKWKMLLSSTLNEFSIEEGHNEICIPPRSSIIFST